MKSMTGFGSAEGMVAGRRYKIEISSINSRKGVDLSVNLPRDLAALENEVRAIVEKEVSRGRMSVSIQQSQKSSKTLRPLSIDKELLKKYLKELKAAGKELGTGTDLPLEFLLKLPGVMQENGDDNAMEAFGPGLLKLLQKALKDFHASREREGKHLCEDLDGRITTIEKHQVEVLKLQPAVMQRQRENLQRRVKEAGLEVALDDERLLKEIILISDRCDVSEELTRLKHHLEEARRLLKSKKAIGRNLDFLIQEIGREINTTGSKANDLGVSRRVIEMKTELEKIREQVQNLE